MVKNKHIYFSYFFHAAGAAAVLVGCIPPLSSVIIRLDTFEWRGVRFVFSKVFQSCVSAKACSWILTAIWAFLIITTVCRIVIEYQQNHNHVNNSKSSNEGSYRNNKTYLNPASTSIVARRAESTVTSSSSPHR